MMNRRALPSCHQTKSAQEGGSKERPRLRKSERRGRYTVGRPKSDDGALTIKHLDDYRHDDCKQQNRDK